MDSLPKFCHYSLTFKLFQTVRVFLLLTTKNILMNTFQENHRGAGGRRYHDGADRERSQCGVLEVSSRMEPIETKKLGVWTVLAVEEGLQMGQDIKHPGRPIRGVRGLMVGRRVGTGYVSQSFQGSSFYFSKKDSVACSNSAMNIMAGSGSIGCNVSNTVIDMTFKRVLLKSTRHSSQLMKTSTLEITKLNTEILLLDMVNAG